MSERDEFEARMLKFGWRNFTGEIRGDPPCWYYDNAELQSRWFGWREARAALAQQQVPQPMETAPKDGTMLRLLVQYENYSFDDSNEPWWVCGFNLMDNTGEDKWQFPGWSWEHDYILEASDDGKPIAWLPMLASAPPAPQAEQPSTEMGGPIAEGWQLSASQGHSGYGVYAHMTEYPEEGAVLLLALHESPAEDALRAIASYLGVGGYNAPHVDAAEYQAKIIEAIAAKQPRQTVGLTDEKVAEIWVEHGCDGEDAEAFARATIAKFCEVNGIPAPKEQP